MKEFDEFIRRKRKGSLKLYLGYAAGVGKTYQMLQEGHRLRARGIDVVIGYIEPHARPETIAQIGDLERIPCLLRPGTGERCAEMDVDAIIRRRPQVVLVDELAHSNEPGSKHEKRYQDVADILDQEISVISTMNVQHLESIAEKVAATTNAPVQERVPDHVLRMADQVVVVDVAMEELRERLRQGKIYRSDQAETALVHFFTYQNLSFLRELLLREVAGDQVRKIAEQHVLSKEQAAVGEEAVMVAMSSNPTNAEVLIRKAARLATQLSTRCYLVYVQVPTEAPTKIDASLQRRLQNNLKLAQVLGAEIVTIKSDHITDALLNFAIDHNVKHIIFGKSRQSPLKDRIKGSILLDFIHDSVGIDVHVVTTEGRGV